MGSANRLHRRTCYTKKEPPRRISEVLKVAATSSPTIYRSAVPSAMLSLSAALAPLPRLSAPLSPASARSALSPAPAPSPARRRRAQPTPRMAHTAPHSATPPPLRHTYHPPKLAYSSRLHKRYGLSQ